ncbi:MAG: hypothetical protein KF781_06895 [Chitinophagaceae bacterium]|nr:hypothetical protein [Chitinophagaceae bacterium]MCW5904051.1 hypothetical protein [Chitinophagaceae bacterium]
MSNKFWKGLIVIFIIYTCYYIFFLEASYLLSIPRPIRHLIKLFTLIAVYLLGVYQLNSQKIGWMTTIWHIIHITGIVLICLFGIYDWIFGILPIKIRWVLGSIAEFLIAPTLYIAMGLIQYFLLKEKIKK